MDGFSVHNWSYRTSWSKLLCRELVEQAKICYAENHWKSTILSGRNRSSRHFSQDEYEDLCSDESFVLGTTLFFVPWVLFISVSRVASLSQGKFLKVVVQFSLHNIYRLPYLTKNTDPARESKNLAYRRIGLLRASELITVTPHPKPRITYLSVVINIKGNGWKHGDHNIPTRNHPSGRYFSINSNRTTVLDRSYNSFG